MGNRIAESCGYGFLDFSVDRDRALWYNCLEEMKGRSPMFEFKKGLLPFWSEALIDSKQTTATLSVNRAQRAETVLTLDRPWEGNGGTYTTVLHDGEKYRMYYQTCNLTVCIGIHRISVCVNGTGAERTISFSSGSTTIFRSCWMKIRIALGRSAIKPCWREDFLPNFRMESHRIDW